MLCLWVKLVKYYEVPKSALQSIINPKIKVHIGNAGRPRIITTKVLKSHQECHKLLLQKNYSTNNTKIKEKSELKMSKSTICDTLNMYELKYYTISQKSWLNDSHMYKRVEVVT